MSPAPGTRAFEVAIVGGGIAGLAAAHHLLAASENRRVSEAERSAPLRVTVLEASERFGGRVQTERHSSLLLEAGSDSLVTHKPEGLELIRNLGLGDELIEPRSGYEPTQVVHRGRLASLPSGLALLAPTRALPLLRSPLLSWRGKLRALAEPLVAARRGGGDESVSSFVSRRFGRELLERMAEPLLGDSSWPTSMS